MNAAGWALVALSMGAPLSRTTLVLTRVEPAALQVTLGEVRPRPGGFTSGSPKLRAVAPGFRGAAELRFQYLGPTEEESPLGSGEIRRQLGLKLNAENGCNVVYVMWRIDPVPGLVVQVKENPGQDQSVDCGNRGYRNVHPSNGRPVPLLVAGDRHTLRAELSGRTLTVWVDCQPVWEGLVSDSALPFDGPVGVRADNARIDGELWGLPEAENAPPVTGTTTSSSPPSR